MTDAEIARFLCREVLGWKWHLKPKQYRFHDQDGGWRHKDSGRPIQTATPDFLTWDGFGLLLTALAKPERSPGLDYEADIPNQWTAYVYGDNHEFPMVAIDPDPKRALMRATARAYNMEGL